VAKAGLRAEAWRAEEEERRGGRGGRGCKHLLERFVAVVAAERADGAIASGGRKVAGGTAKAAKAARAARAAASAAAAAAAAVELVQRSARRVARARAGLHRRGAPAVDEALHHVVVERRRLACAATVSTPHEAHMHVGRRR